MFRKNSYRDAIKFACMLLGVVAFSAVNAQKPDLKMEVFAGPDQVQNVTALCFDDQGRVYVAESHRWRNGVEDNRDHLFWVMDDLASQTVEDRRAMIKKWEGNFAPDYFIRDSERVIQLQDTDGDGKADHRTVFADGFNDPVDGPAIGLISGFGKIYLASIPHVWALKDTDGDGVADSREVIQSGFGPRFSLSGHDLHGFAWGPDGKLYFSVGDRGYHLETREGKILANPGAGAVFRCEPDGSEMQLFYHNLRNPQELAFNEYGDLFTVDNNSDQGDKARVSYLLEGGDTGWNMGHQALTTFKDQIEDGGMGQVPHWLSENLWQTRHEDQPEWILPPIDYLTEGPSGLVFNSGTSLPGHYKNHFLVCDYKGSSSQCFVYSFKVEQSGAGYEMRDDHVFSSGITAADVDMGYDGKVYLGDFGGGWLRPDTGNVVTLHDPETITNPVVKETQELFASGFDNQTVERLGELLAHPDWRVRQRSQFTLAARGEEGNRLLKEVLAKVDHDLFSRLHSLWGLRQQKDKEAIAAYLKDEESEIRAHAARALGDLKSVETAQEIAKLLTDESPRVRSFAAIALGKVGGAGELPALVQMVEDNHDADAYLRHSGIMGFVGMADPEQLVALADSSSRAVRLAAVVALRRMHASEISRFLTDPDMRIQNEVIRAINDLHLTDAYSAVIDYSKRWVNTSAKVELPSEILFRRIINIHFRHGTPSSAGQLALFGMNVHLPVEYRQLALQSLALWAEPPAIDPTLGLYHPLPNRNPSEAVAAVQDPLMELLQSPNIDPKLIASATHVAQTFDINVPPSLLADWLTDRAQLLEVRLAALEQFQTDPPKMFRAQLSNLLEDPSAEMRTAVAEGIAKLYPKDAMAMVRRLMQGETTIEKRGAIKIMTETQAPEVVTVIEDQLEKLVEGHLDPSLALDLYEGASVRQEASVQEALAEVDQSLAEDGKDLFTYTLEGGDPERGARIFANQGTCLKCHRVRSGGGTAGPSLFGIGSRLSPEKLVESMVDPNREVIGGYGIVSVTLKDGSTVTGTPLERTESVFRIQTAQTDPVEVPLEEIASETPTLSSMPPMALVLPKKDVRDLVAYLRGLKEIP